MSSATLCSRGEGLESNTSCHGDNNALILLVKYVLCRFSILVSPEIDETNPQSFYVCGVLGISDLQVVQGVEQIHIRPKVGVDTTH